MPSRGTSCLTTQDENASADQKMRCSAADDKQAPTSDKTAGNEICSPLGSFSPSFLRVWYLCSHSITSCTEMVISPEDGRYADMNCACFPHA
jgi:hypothetical protein